MNEKKLILSNTIYVAIESVVGLIVGLVLARIMVIKIGAALYGAYVLLSLFSGYGILSMIDLGMGGAVTVFSAQYMVTKPEKVKGLWIFSVIYYMVVSLLAGVLSTLIIMYYDKNISTNIISLGLTKSVLVPTILLVVFTFLSYMVDSFLKGFSDYAFMEIITIIMHIVRLVCIGYIVFNAIAFIYIMWVLVFCTLVRYLLLLVYLYNKYPGMIGFGAVEYSDAIIWLKYSLSLFVSSISGFIFNVADKILISVYLPVVAMANYDIAGKPDRIMRSGMSVLLSAVIPASARYSALGEKEKLKVMYFRGSIWISLIMMPPALYIYITMPEFISLWVGNNYMWLAKLSRLMMFYLFFSSASSLANTMLAGIGYAKQMIPGQIISSGLNFALSIILVKNYGLNGLAVGTIAGYALGSIVYWILIWKYLSIGIQQFIKEYLYPMILLIVFSLLCIFGINSIVLLDKGIYQYAGSAAICILLSYFLSYLFLVNSDEREYINKLIKGFIKIG
jgi:O-antigen/teichoic acid export membrane protein